jgi:hypothetical protein
MIAMVVIVARHKYQQSWGSGGKKGVGLEICVAECTPPVCIYS